MKRLMIIGASILQLPAIRKAKEMGLYVAVADYNPDAIGIPYADEYYNVSTIDEAGVCAAAKAFRADGIMTLATDMPMRSVAYSCSALGLTGISYDTAVKATDKGEMIKAFDAANVAHPWYYILEKDAAAESLKGKIAYPCILKPTDNAGSRGVTLVNSPDALEAAIAYSRGSSRSGNVIIEEYMTGAEVSVEVMVWQNAVHVLQITDKLTTGAPHFVEMGHSQPSRLPAADLDAIRDLAIRAVKAVGIESGPAHVEIMLTDQGPKMVELGARMGGDCITSHLVPLSTGIDMVKATIDISLGLAPDIIPKFAKGSAIRFFNGPEGIISAIKGGETAKQMPGVLEISFTKAVGDRITAIASSTDRIGFVIAQAETAAGAACLCQDAAGHILIETTS